ncbi:MAG: beta-hydroxyacyl-ACP dehydratase [Bacteroidales bacterium]|nr:beta-hydroxyacyl-ACP dehydratase [Bacteroidales bacterium]
MTSDIDIRKLIPQREPILMVDSLIAYDPDGARTEFTVPAGNLFVRDGVLAEPGIIEHIAQSAAAWGGYPFFIEGRDPVPGYIGEIKDFSIIARPAVGSVLKTTLKVLGSASGTTLMQSIVTAGEQEVALGRIKIHIGEK